MMCELEGNTRTGSFKKKDLNLSFRFFWTSHLNSTTYHHLQSISEESTPNDLLVLGFGLWPIKFYDCSEEVIEDYRRNLTRFQGILNKLSDKMEVIWYTQPSVYRALSKNRNYPCKTIEVNLEIFNDIAEKGFEGKKVHVWSSTASMATQRLDFYRDVVHPGQLVYENYVQILLNFLCNNYIRPSGKNFCCGPSSEDTIHAYNYIGLLCSGLIILVLGKELLNFMRTSDKQQCPNEEENIPELNSVLLPPATDQFMASLKTDGHGIHNASLPTGSSITFGMAKMSCILVFIFAINRSDIFIAQRKVFEEAEFLVWVISCTALAVVSLRSIGRKGSTTAGTEDEFRGIILIVIIICNVNGGPTTGAMSIIKDVLVSALLWTSGYEIMERHLTEASTISCSLFEVFFRLNFLNIFLGFAITKRSLVSMLPLLMSVWQVTISGVLTLPPRTKKINEKLNEVSYPLLFLKSFSLLGIVQILFLMMRSLFNPAQSSELIISFVEQWELHRFSAIVGMMTVLTEHWLKEKEKLSLRRLLSAVLGLSLILGWILCITSESTNLLPFTLCIPIVAFSMLRNFAPLRGFRSAFLTWTGEMWLELLLSQTLLLSGLENNMLVILLPFWTRLNRLIIIFICFTMARELRNVTILILGLILYQNLKPLQSIFFGLLIVVLTLMTFCYNV